MTGSAAQLEERIERSMARLAERGGAGLELDDIVARHSGRASRWTVGLAAASVVALGAGALLLAGTDSEPPASAPTTRPEAAAVPAPPLYLPASVPDGFVLTHAERHSGSPGLNAGPGFVLAVPTETGGYRDPIRIMLTDHLLTDDEVVYEHNAVELNGSPAELLRSDTYGTSLLQWTIDGHPVVVWNEVAANQPGTEALLTAVANAVVLMASGLTVSGQLPAGLEIVATWPAAFPGTFSGLGYTGDGATEVDVTITNDPPPNWQFVYLDDGLEPVRIGDHNGWISENEYPDEAESPPSTRTVTWFAEPNIHIAVSGEGLTPEQLIAFAETLRPVDEATWDDAVADVVMTATT